MTSCQVSATRADDVIIAPADLHKSLPLFALSVLTIDMLLQDALCFVQ